MLSERAKSLFVRRNPPATEEAIRQFQEAVRVQIPPDYLDFVRQSNGAGMEDGWLSELNSILNDSSDYGLPDRVFMIGTDGGGTAYCYDFGYDPPALFGLDMDSPGETKNWRYYGSSFDGFLCHLAGGTTEPKPKAKLKKAKAPKIDESVRKIRVDAGFDYASSPITSIAIAPDGRYLLAGAILYDLTEDKTVRMFGTNGAPTFFTNGGSQYVQYTYEAASQKMVLCDLATGDTLASCPAMQRVIKAAISGDARIVAFESTGAIVVWDIEKKMVKGQVTRKNHIEAVALSADGKFLAILELGRKPESGATAMIFLVDTDTFRVIETLYESPEMGPCLTFYKDGRILLSTNNFARILDQSGKELLTVREPMGAVSACLPVGDDRLLVTTKSGTITLYDTTGKLLRKLAGPKGSTDVAAVSDDGKLLVTGGEKHKTLRVWDLR